MGMLILPKISAENIFVAKNGRLFHNCLRQIFQKEKPELLKSQ